MHIPFLLSSRLFEPNTCVFKTIIAPFLFILFVVPGICRAAELYEYDQYNRLCQVDGESVNMEFEYDGAGNRIVIRSNTSDTASDRTPSNKKYLASAKINKDDTEKVSTSGHIKTVNSNAVRNSRESKSHPTEEK